MTKGKLFELFCSFFDLCWQKELGVPRAPARSPLTTSTAANTSFAFCPEHGLELTIWPNVFCIFYQNFTGHLVIYFIDINSDSFIKLKSAKMFQIS